MATTVLVYLGPVDEGCYMVNILYKSYILTNDRVILIISDILNKTLFNKIKKKKPTWKKERSVFILWIQSISRVYVVSPFLFQSKTKRYTYISCLCENAHSIANDKLLTTITQHLLGRVWKESSFRDDWCRGWKGTFLIFRQPFSDIHI